MTTENGYLVAGLRPQEVLSHLRERAPGPAGGKSRQSRRRRELQHRPGRSAGPGGRERLWQDHDRARDPARRTVRPRARSCSMTRIRARWIWRSLNRDELRDIWRNIQLIFQDPYSSLNPRMTLEQIVGEPLHNYGVLSGSALAGPGGGAAAPGRPAPGIHDALSARLQRRPAPAHRHRPRPGAQPAVDHLRRAGLGPGRVDPGPDLEPAPGFAGPVPSDLPVHLPRSERGAAPQRPRGGDVRRQDRRNRDDRRRCSTIPSIRTPRRCCLPRPTPDPRAERKHVPLEGEVADPANPPSGCYFHPRCQFAKERCKTEAPALREIKPGHWAACHFSEKLALAG